MAEVAENPQLTRGTRECRARAPASRASTSLATLAATPSPSCANCSFTHHLLVLPGTAPHRPRARGLRSSLGRPAHPSRDQAPRHRLRAVHRRPGPDVQVRPRRPSVRRWLALGHDLASHATDHHGPARPDGCRRPAATRRSPISTSPMRRSTTRPRNRSHRCGLSTRARSSAPMSRTRSIRSSVRTTKRASGRSTSTATSRNTYATCPKRRVRGLLFRLFAPCHPAGVRLPSPMGTERPRAVGQPLGDALRLG